MKPCNQIRRIKQTRHLQPALAFGLAALTWLLQSQCPAADWTSPVNPLASGKCASVLPPETPGNPAWASEAPASYCTNDNNGYLSKSAFRKARDDFEAISTFEDGLGPTYNAQSCRECHQNVNTGTANQVEALRTMRYVNGQYFSSPAGSIVQARATYPNLVEKIGPEDNLRSFRRSLNVLGDGFVECVADSTLLSNRDAQPVELRGVAMVVPILELTNYTQFGPTNALRVGRFGWKAQHGSLLSFAADAALNELGLTSPLEPQENLAEGVFVGYGSGYDPLPEPEDRKGQNIADFADFIRATDVPAATNQDWSPALAANVAWGKQVFTSIGCAFCHTPTLITAAPGSIIYVGTRVGGGPLVVSKALGNKIFHPYGDFLLHDIGTGDGIPIQTDQPETANLMRTPPLWGLRTRNRLLHDLEPLTVPEAILRHAGQASGVVQNYQNLSATDQQALLDFLNSL